MPKDKHRKGEKKRKAGKKESQLAIRVEKSERDAFVALCDRLDTSAAREIRRFMRDFVARHEPEAGAPAPGPAPEADPEADPEAEAAPAAEPAPEASAPETSRAEAPARRPRKPRKPANGADAAEAADDRPARPRPGRRAAAKAADR